MTDGRTRADFISILRLYHVYVRTAWAKISDADAEIFADNYIDP